MIRASTWILVCALGLLFLACTPEERVLSGRWISKGPVPLLPDGSVEVEMELLLGHYGPDVVGIMRLKRPMNPNECACSLVEHGDYKNGGFFSFYASEALSCPDLEEVNDHPELTAANDLQLHLILTLKDDRLVGDLHYLYLPDGGSSVVVLERDETDPLISEEDKSCD